MEGDAVLVSRHGSENNEGGLGFLFCEMEMTLPFVVLKTKWDVICDQVLWEVRARACPKLVVTEG